MKDEVKEEPRATDMELRDYFAAKVLAQICLQLSPYKAATHAYIHADAMIAVRQEGKKYV